jgi:hypothetical protein
MCCYHCENWSSETTCCNFWDREEGQQDLRCGICFKTAPAKKYVKYIKRWMYRLIGAAAVLGVVLGVIISKWW